MYTGAQHQKRIAATLATDRLIVSLDELLSTLQDAETGQRGYLLTGSRLYLTPYIGARREADGHLSTVKTLGSEVGLLSSTWDALEEVIKSKLNELELTLSLYTSGNPAAAVAELRTGRGQRQMSQIRELLGQIKLKQTASYKSLAEQTKASEQHLMIVLGFGGALSVLLLIAASRLIQNYIEERDLVEGEIRSLNEGLEQRVRERTAELEARTKLSEAQAAELERSNADLAQFASVASHDLQEPLRMVASYMGMLSRRYGPSLDETARTYMQFATSGALRMQTLISDLLAYSRAGTQAVAKQPVSFDQVVSKAAENLQLVIRENSVHIQSTDLPDLQADEVKLVQVLQNLLANAIKFRKPDVPPQIKIAAQRRGPEWLFSVADNGIGFDPKYGDRIFQVFQRLHTANRYPGNGIGLSICRRIIEHHGGCLWAESEPGAGSTFFFTLPGADKTADKLQTA